MARFSRVLSTGLAVCSILTLFLISGANAAVWYVQPGGTGSGTSWGNSYGSISDALIAATTEDELWVAGGVYSGTIEMKNGVAIYGGFAGNELAREERNWKTNLTVIDATGFPDSVVTGANNALMDGFTLTGGTGKTAPIVTAYGTWGGGVLCAGTSPTFANCTITGNSALMTGGGVYCSKSHTVFYNCTISANNAPAAGGIFSGASTPNYPDDVDYSRFINCTISNNTANHGGGLSSIYSSARFTNCAIINNQATQLGDGNGGGIECWESAPLFENCTIAGNYADANGSGVFTHSMYYGDVAASFVNCILKNTGTEVVAVSDIIFTYCCIEGGYEGEGNISSDPLFVDEAGSDYRLQAGSPCIDAGNPSFYYNDACLPPGQNTPRNDMGIYGGPKNCNVMDDEDPDLIDLFVDTPYNSTLTIGQAAYFIAWSTGCSNLGLNLDGDYIDGIVEVYARRGQIPTRYQYDYASIEPAQAFTDRELLIPACGDGPWYVMLYCTYLDTAQMSYTLESTNLPLQVSDVSPNKVSNGWLAKVRLYGVGFTNNTTVRLKNQYKTFLTAQKVTLLNLTSLEAEFDFRQVAPSLYDIEVLDSGESATLTEAITVVQSQGAEFSASIYGPWGVRVGPKYAMQLHYENTGDEPMTAPMFILSSTSGTPTSYSRDGSYTNSPKWVLGIDPEGDAGILAPGAKGNIPIYFRGESGSEFALFVVDDQDAILSWDVPEWQTWGDYNEALADVASRLSRRGQTEYLVEDLEDFARAERAGEAVSAISGVVLNQSTKVPLKDVVVYAVGSGLTGRAVTDSQGRFVIENLATGDYTIALLGYSTASTVNVTIPTGDDVYGVELQVQVDPSALAKLANTTEPTIPSSLARPLGPKTFYDDYAPVIVTSFDPNEKNGPIGTGAPNYSISMTAPMHYVAYFENQATATAAVQELVIGDPLSSDIDWTSFELGTLSFGDNIFTIAPGQNHYSTRVTVDMWTYDGSSWITNGDAWVDIEASVDMATGLATWTLTVLDPLTGYLPTDPYAGFLPPNDGTGRGQGYVSFSVLPKGSLTSGTVISNNAQIVFDYNDAITTNTWTNTVVEALPGSIVNVFPPDGANGVPQDTYLDWENTAGAVTYNVYLWKEGQSKPTTPTASALTASSYLPSVPLEEYTGYNWQIIAVNGAGQTEGDVWQLSTFIEGSLTSVPAPEWSQYK